MSDEWVKTSTEDLFVLWNLRLLEVFFSPASNGEEVWLQVNALELDSIGPDLGGDEGFVNAVKGGPPWGTIKRASSLWQTNTQVNHLSTGTSSQFVGRSTGLALQRQFLLPRPESYVDPGEMNSDYVGKNAPVYLPYLAALVRSEADKTRDGFYKHLQDSFGLDRSWQSVRMDEMREVWEDLAAWTEETGGAFGRFKFRVLGGYEKIGVPRSQCIMSGRDSSLMARVFAQVGLRPGQQLDGSVVEEIRHYAETAFFLSKGYREALAKAEFAEPISVRIHTLFDDWDGTVPSLGGASVLGGVVGEGAEPSQDLEVCLRLQNGNQFPWMVLWRIPAFRDAGRCFIEHKNSKWEGSFRGTEAITTLATSAAEIREAARLVLAESSSTDVEFRLKLEGDGAAEAIPEGTITLPRKILRVFRWERNAITGVDELRERPLPLHGAAYLLASEDNVDRLLNYLDREELEFKEVPNDGLPSGWLLVCLVDCSSVTEEQRNTMPDGQNQRPAPRAVRLVGGLAIRRAGARQYLSYDLPVVELDAPIGAKLQAGGLRFEEEVSAGSEASVRRFYISIEGYKQRSFMIEARQGAKILGNARLRIASDSGEHVNTASEFYIDRYGRPSTGEVGMRGLLPEAAIAKFCIVRHGRFSLDCGTIGRKILPGEIKHPESLAVVKFMDLLARLGSLAYGKARDILVGLLGHELGRYSPATVLLELRGRGFIELETNHKGHLIRVHAIAPVLYELPVNVNSNRLFGVGGTLRITHWEALSRSPSAQLFSPLNTAKLLDAWLLTVEDTAEFEAFADAKGFDCRGPQSAFIAQWAASAEEVRYRLEQYAGETAGTVKKQLKRFNPGNLRFFPIDGQMSLDPSVRCQLFSMEDPETKLHQVYSLGIRTETGLPRFAFVSDSRWGAWLALSAFAEFAREMFRIEDASPWPISYSVSSGTIWLPARINLPIVLERALTLCSGDGPAVIDAEGETEGQNILLRRKRDGSLLCTVSRVYEDMANGKWLAYRWVPKPVAEFVVGKVGGALVEC